MAVHTFVAGEAFTAAQANTINTGADGGTYTPTLTGMAVGTGGSAANSASFTFIGGVLTVEGSLTFGSSGTTFPTAPTVALPAGYTILSVVNNRPCGQVTLSDSGVGNRHGRVKVSTSTTVSIVYDFPDASVLKEGAISTTLPFTWAAGDSMIYAFTVRAVAA